MILPRLEKGGYDEVDPEKYLLEHHWVKVNLGSCSVWKETEESETFMFMMEAVRKQHERDEIVRSVMDV